MFGWAIENVFHTKTFNTHTCCVQNLQFTKIVGEDFSFFIPSPTDVFLSAIFLAEKLTVLLSRNDAVEFTLACFGATPKTTRRNLRVNFFFLNPKPIRDRACGRLGRIYRRPPSKPIEKPNELIGGLFSRALRPGPGRRRYRRRARIPGTRFVPFRAAADLSEQEKWPPRGARRGFPTERSETKGTVVAALGVSRAHGIILVLLLSLLDLRVPIGFSPFPLYLFFFSNLSRYENRLLYGKKI